MNQLMLPRSHSRGRAAQQGIALITSLLILVIVTLVAVSMYRSFGLQEKITGNTLEKQRSLLAADSALRYAEWWINQGNTGTGSACAGVQANMKICSNALGTPAVLPWTSRYEYKPPSMTVLAGGGLNTATSGVVGDVNYATTPSLYISYLGIGPDGKSMLYQVTGVGYGGSTTSASVLQSTYAMTYATKDLSGP
ncbi:pilus assembly PilX family protein [Variovorax sp. LT1R16]|uniref:pilus assembly PilX family protein n=1 Tax=Variovorax sp. LT1R16 TaxID=3443728 RepID=UPI003F463FA0